MPKPSTDTPLKKLLAEIAESVSGLPKHLQSTAFSTLLEQGLPKLKSSTPSSEGSGKTILTGGSFGEYFHSFPSKTKEDVKFLVAASFAETQSDDRTFTIESAHTLLKDIGVPLSNAGVFARQVLKKKWALTVSKVGKKTYKYRVSLKGHTLLKEIKEKE